MDRRTKLTKHIVSIALAKTGNISHAAVMLGVTRCTVQRAMKRWGLARPIQESVADTPKPPVLEELRVEAPELGANWYPALRERIETKLSKCFSGVYLGDVGKRH